ncbi:MAG: ATP synthase F1 subunit gamma [Planctomycetota bacterium]|jgi:F-type H+-transporting ATPase subunit gamma
MANRRLLLKRRKAVRNIRKITRTMQLIATARFQAALGRATASKPYTAKLAELVNDLAGVAEDVRHPLLTQPAEENKASTLTITSDRGLCGGYNVHVLRKSIHHLDGLVERGVTNDVQLSGKKGVNYFKFLGRHVERRITSIGDAPKFEDVMVLADDLMDRFVKGEISSSHVVYMKFHSMGRQRPEVMQLLPLVQERREGEEGTQAARPDYEFSPEPKELLDELLPATVRIRLYQCFLDAVVSEQIARMVAMKAATDAAGDMITTLTRHYNRARQTHITMELLDIVGGANALA